MSTTTPVAGSGIARSDAREQRSKVAVELKPVARFFGPALTLPGAIGLIEALCVIFDYHPRPAVIEGFFVTYVATPAVVVVRRLSHQLDYLPVLFTNPQFVKSAALWLVVGCFFAMLYVSLQMSLWAFDKEGLAAKLRSFGVVVVTLASLPLAMLAIVWIAHKWFGTILSPFGIQLIDAYHAVVRSWIGPLVDPIYAAILSVVGWRAPSWLRHLATISIISVAMNRKAWLREDATHFDLEFKTFWDWLKDTAFNPVTAFDVIEMPFQVVAVVAAYLIGWLFLLPFFGWRRPAEAIAAIVFVFVRGIFLLGLLFPIEHTYERIFLQSKMSRHDREANTLYFVYVGITLLLVGAFFVSFHP